MEINFKAKGEGRDMLVLHGWGGSILSLQPLADILSTKGYKVWTCDLPGFGASPKSKSTMSLADYAEFIGEFIELHQLHNPILVGHSFGGKIAANYCITNGNLISELVLIDASGIKSKNSAKKSILKNVSKVGKGIFSLPGLRRLEPLAEKAFYKGVVREHDYYDAEEMKSTLARVVEEHLDNTIPKIKNRTLVIWGSNDSYVPLWMGKKYQELLPRAELVIIPDATHGLPLHNPAIVAEHIDNFLSHTTD